MAYMRGDEGPYPNKAGEYCGNHFLKSLPLRLNNESWAEAMRNQKAYLSKMRFGRPHPCEAGTTKEMAARGYVGLYLKQDRPLRPGEGTEIPTPPELQEPLR